MSAFEYDHWRPALAVDCVVFGADFDQNNLQLLLIQRGLAPFEGRWALPGGFVRQGEDVRQAATRELQEEAGLRDVYLEQLYTFSDSARDPREHVVTVAHTALVRPDQHVALGATDARDARWFSLAGAPPVAFDHQRIVDMALERLQGKVRYHPVGFELLPETFTLSQVQQLYEMILGQGLDKRNFQRKIHKLGVLVDTGKLQRGVAHRAAKFYTLDRARWLKLLKEGQDFRI